MDYTSREIVLMQNRLGFLFEAGADAAEREDHEELARIDEEVESIYAELAGGVPEKLVALRHVVRRIEAETADIREQEKILAVARRSREKGVDRLKGWMLSLLQGHRMTHSETTLKAGGYSFWTATTQRLLKPDDPALWPPEWRKVKTEVRFDTAAFKEDQKAGVALPDGFAMEAVEGVRFR